MFNPIKKLFPLIVQAIKIEGSYNPEKIMPHMFEYLTEKQYHLVNGFLQYVHGKKLTFGDANFDEVYTLYLRSLGAKVS